MRPRIRPIEDELCTCSNMNKPISWLSGQTPMKFNCLRPMRLPANHPYIFILLLERSSTVPGTLAVVQARY